MPRQYFDQVYETARSQSAPVKAQPPEPPLHWDIPVALDLKAFPIVNICDEESSRQIRAAGSAKDEIITIGKETLQKSFVQFWMSHKMMLGYAVQF